MSYKLNDFTNINKPSFAAELDEQIRLLCDVLYNQREIYPGQLSSPTAIVFENTRRWQSVYVIRTYTSSFQNGNQTQLATNCGVAAVGTFSATAGVQTKQNSLWTFGTYETSTTLDAVAGLSVHSSAAAVQGTFNPIHNPYSLFIVQTTEESIVNRAFFVGLCSGGDAVPTTITSTNRELPNAYTGLRNFIGFRYIPSFGFWYIGSRNETSAATWTATSVGVSVDTIYKFEIETINAGVSWILKINGTIVGTLISNLPETGTTSLRKYRQFAHVVNTVGGAGSEARLNVSHIYAKYGNG